MQSSIRPLNAAGFLALGALLWPAPAVAQQSSDTDSGIRTPRVATAVRVERLAPRLDGVLDDEIWQNAPVFSGFLQRDPDEGEPGTEQTEFRVAYADDAIYVAVRAYDSHADQISAHLTRRDAFSPSDWIGIQIDSYRDRRTGFEFVVNPAGVKRDRYLYDDNSSDGSWNAVWDVATMIDAGGWSAEFRIPLSQLRFSQAEDNVFGFNVYRDINRNNERQYWRLLPKGESGVVSLFGDLVGLRGISPPRRVEVLPYTVMSNATSPAQDGNPFQTGTSRSMTMGADVNIGLTSALTLSATFFPDFGQVEADPAVVNLSAFETFFPEKRPFFNEGLDIFQFGINGGGGRESLFYTRRIGRSPQGSADPRGGFAERVNNTTIYSAAKISGKTQDGWTIGLLGALTAPERAAVVDATGGEHNDLVEPQGNYFVGRLAKDLRGGMTVVGVFGTAVNRPNLENLSFLRDQAYSGGVDWNHRFENDTYSWDGRILASRISGPADAIARAQLSSARYFQRPDNDYREFDPTRTSLSGFAGAMTFGKKAGNVRWRAGIDTRSPGFEVNDLGFQSQADNIGQWLWIQRRWLEPGRAFRRFNVNLNQWSNHTYGWERRNFGTNVNMNFTLLNYWNGWAGINYNVASRAIDALRGGPAFRRPAGINGWSGFQSDFRKSFRFGLNGWWFAQPEADVWAYGISPNVSWRPATNMDFSLGPNFNKNRDTWQYLRSAEVNGGTEYIFGDLTQTTLSMQFRGNMTFTPDLSLQLYAEPFVATGDYTGYSRVTNPIAGHFDDQVEVFGQDRLIDDGSGGVGLDVTRNGVADIAVGNPDFTFLSFRSNVVLRWEYVLGSTFFLVWQHGRTGFNDNGQFDFNNSIGDLFEAEASNTFLVKLNYWLSL